jgi:hypothetical protein
MVTVEEKMRATAHALPVSDFGSHRAIQAAARLAEQLVFDERKRCRAAVVRHMPGLAMARDAILEEIDRGDAQSGSVSDLHSARFRREQKE